MAENYILQDALLSELSDVNLFCKLIRYPSIRDNMYKVFKVSEMKNQLLQFLPHLTQHIVSVLCSSFPLSLSFACERFVLC
jgi:hypothetical protein